MKQFNLNIFQKLFDLNSFLDELYSFFPELREYLIEEKEVKDHILSFIKTDFYEIELIVNEMDDLNKMQFIDRLRKQVNRLYATVEEELIYCQGEILRFEGNEEFRWRYNPDSVDSNPVENLHNKKKAEINMIIFNILSDGVTLFYDKLRTLMPGRSLMNEFLRKEESKLSIKNEDKFLEVLRFWYRNSWVFCDGIVVNRQTYAKLLSKSFHFSGKNKKELRLSTLEKGISHKALDISDPDFSGINGGELIVKFTNTSAKY